MGLLAGKTSTERNKIIAAGVLGLVSLIALYMAFGRSFFGSSTTAATTKSSPTPKPVASPGTSANNKFKLPTKEEQDLNVIVPVVYRRNSYAPDPGRNIFAFYEPPPATPFVPPPPPTPTPPPPASPTPTPAFAIAAVDPQNVYAGSKQFRLNINGDRFTPDARIYFNQTEMPTVFVNPRQLSTNIPDNLISQPGQRQIIVQTPDGQSYSFPATLTVQAPPKPTSLQYIGMIGRARYNNDTAYFTQTGNPTPFGARLNDVVGGRFRITGISASAVTVEDVTLGFKHSIPMITVPGSAPPSIPFSSPQGVNPTLQGRPRPGQTPQKPDVDDNDPDKP